MTKSLHLWGFLGLALLSACHSSATGAGTAASSDAAGGGGATGATGGPDGTGGVASAIGGDGSGNTNGMLSDGGMSSSGAGVSGISGGASLPPDVLAGSCPRGFVACYGVCLEAALMGADCKPAMCPAPPAGTTPPSRSGGVSARGFTWSVTNDSSGTTVTFKPGPAGGGLSPTVGAALKLPTKRSVTAANSNAHRAPPVGRSLGRRRISKRATSSTSIFIRRSACRPSSPVAAPRRPRRR